MVSIGGKQKGSFTMRTPSELSIVIIFLQRLLIRLELIKMVFR